MRGASSSLPPTSMAPGVARLALVSVLAIQCVLWSQSRYGKMHGLPNSSSLSKRDSISGENQCRPLSVPVPEQCAHVQGLCPPTDTFLDVPYLQDYFCTQESLRPLNFVSLLVWLIFLFSTLGISASDFFTPNLATIAQLLGLDDNVAGVTFLAFGNGSPDVFSTFSAMRADSGSLAVGELLGAASFIVSCVVGALCIIRPFRVHRLPFLRDVGFFSVAVTMLLVILWDGHIRAWEAWMLVGLYVFYVAVVIVGSYWERRQARLRCVENLVRGEYNDAESTTFVRYLDSPEEGTLSPGSLRPPSTSPRSRAISNPGPPRLDLQTNLTTRPHSRAPSNNASPTSSLATARLPHFSLIGALEFRHVVASLRDQASGSSLSIFDSPVTPFAGGHYHARSRSLSRTSRAHSPTAETDPFDAAALRLNTRSPPQVTLTETGGDGDDASRPAGARTPLPSIALLSPTASETTDIFPIGPLTNSQRFRHVAGKVTHTLFPSLQHFGSKSVVGKLASVFAAPAIFALTVTLPVVVTPYEPEHDAEKVRSSSLEPRLVDFEEEGIERAVFAEEEVMEEMHDMKFNKALTVVQCVCGPVFCTSVLFNSSPSLWWILLGSSLFGALSAVLVYFFVDTGMRPMARMARCLLGFFVSVIWIMAIADEVVNVLQTFGFIFGLSDAIIGLTVFAVGNSLADLVANISVASFAPVMGFSASFGGPMLNILLGVGVSGSYIISQTGEPYHLNFTTTLLVSTVGLLALLLATLVFVPWNDYMLTKRWGLFLVASYLVLMVINCVVELKSGRIYTYLSL